MIRRAKGLVDAGRSAIVDGTFLTAKSRIDALALAADGRALPLIIQCHCPDEVAHERITARQAAGDSTSEATPDVHLRQKEAEEPDPPNLPVCHIDATASVPAMIQTVLKRLGVDWSGED